MLIYWQKKHHIEFCRLVSSDNDPESSGHSLFIYEPYFDFKNIEITQETFLINPITNIYIKDDKIFIEGFGYFIKDRDEYYYNNIKDFVNKENLMEYH